MKAIATNGKEVNITQRVIDLIEFISDFDDLNTLGKMKENCSSVGMFLGRLLCCEEERDSVDEEEVKKQLTSLQRVYIEIEYFIDHLKPKDNTQ